MFFVEERVGEFLSIDVLSDRSFPEEGEWVGVFAVLVVVWVVLVVRGRL